MSSSAGSYEAYQRLDQALIAVRHWAHRPAARARLRAQVPRDVDLTTVRVLRVVAAESAPTVGDLARALDVAPSTASRFVAQVVARGAIVRRASEVDGRESHLVLTTEGREILTAINAARGEVLAEATAGWHAVELDRLAGLLERLDAGLDELGEAE